VIFFLTSWTVLSLTVPSLRDSERRLLGADLADAADGNVRIVSWGTGLADRLRRDHADRLADVDHVAGARSRP